MWQGPSQHPLGQEGGFQLRQSRPARTQAALRPAVEAVFLKAALASSPPRPENPALTAGSGPSPCCRVAEASGPCFSPRPLSSTPPDSTAPREPSRPPLPGDRASTHWWGPMLGECAFPTGRASHPLPHTGRASHPLPQRHSLSFSQSRLQHPFLWRASLEVCGLTLSLQAPRNSLPVWMAAVTTLPAQLPVLLERELVFFTPGVSSSPRYTAGT